MQAICVAPSAAGWGRHALYVLVRGFHDFINGTHSFQLDKQMQKIELLESRFSKCSFLSGISYDWVLQSE